jgi:hypothetical protein
VGQIAEKPSLLLSLLGLTVDHHQGGCYSACPSN